MPNKNFNSDAAPTFGDGGKGGKTLTDSKDSTDKNLDFKQVETSFPKQKELGGNFKDRHEMVDIKGRGKKAGDDSHDNA